jgi:putative ABC transport system permease protein
MYSSVAARTTEIATLRAIGFGGLPAFVSTLIESAVLAALGGGLGVAAAFLVFNGLSASTLGASFTQVVFTFEVTPEIATEGVSLALIVGLIGGIFPSIRAARMPILAGLYGS